MSYKILIVDDERLVQTLFCLRFKTEIQEGVYNLIFAFDGVEALEQVKNNQDIDLMLTDINMPKMDGLTLLSRLKEQNISFPTIVISAYSDPRNQRQAKHLGAREFIVKPINFQSLQLRMTELLN